MLWVKKGLGPQNDAQNFLWDFYVYVDEHTTESVHALEYDLWLSQDHAEYMLGTQAHYPDGDGKPGHWDTWNQKDGHWVHNYDKPVSRFVPNQWHHLQWYMQRDASMQTYTYRTLVVDAGTEQEQVWKFDQTQPTGPCDWADAFGVQWQLDLDKDGIDARQYIDKVSVTLW